MFDSIMMTLVFLFIALHSVIYFIEVGEYSVINKSKSFGKFLLGLVCSVIAIYVFTKL